MEPEMIARNTRQLLVLTGVFSAFGGAALGAAATMKYFKLKYEAILEQEIEETKRFYMKYNEKPDSPLEMAQQYPDAETRAAEQSMDKAVQAMHDYTAHHKSKVPAAGVETTVEETDDTVNVQVTVEKNVFEPSEYTGWDLQREIATRSPDQPYVISKDEFMEGALDYQQPTVTWYEGDLVLVDEKSEQLEVDETIGHFNLERFGHGSGDNNIVYVRNDKLSLDFEVLKSDGKFAEEVYGFIEHSHRPGKRKDRRFRGDDE
jgi:hypothetical protein